MSATEHLPMGGGLHLEIDPASGVPPYEQIRSQIVAHVASERLLVGDRLPTIRALAADLGLAAGTVARAYRELEAAGVTTTSRRAGTVVSDGVAPADVVARQAARTFVASVREAGLDDDAILDLVRGELLHRHGD
ncbi:GntR family transcriptional regulator [Oerskovia sp. NPDC056781]|uniref:GntR family transcriptional regulator n=1 Tax=Oerskovia sp. NPDC056781 TaxID=3345942 RepID=UPI003672B510